MDSAKAMYNSFIPKLQKMGLPVEDLDTLILNKMYDKLNQKYDKLDQKIDETVARGKNVVAATPQMTREMGNSFDTILNECKLDTLARDLPKKTTELWDVILAGIKDPKLLAPKLMCGSEAAKDPNDIFGQVMSMIESTEGGSVPAGTPGEANRDVDLIGKKSRDIAWKAVETKFSGVIKPLNPLLDAMKDVPPLINETKTCIAPVEKCVDHVKGLVEAQMKTKADGKAFIACFKDPPPPAEGARSGPTEPGVFETINRSVAFAKTMKASKAEVKVLLKELMDSADGFTKLFENATQVGSKLTQVDVNQVSRGLVDLNNQYPDILENVKNIVKPKGIMAFIFTPSPYVKTVENSVRDVEQLVDLSKVTDALKKGFEPLMNILSIGKDSQADGEGTRDLATTENPSFDLVTKEVQYYIEKSREMEKMYDDIAGGDTDDIQDKLEQYVKESMNESLTEYTQKLKDAGKDALSNAVGGMLSGFFS